MTSTEPLWVKKVNDTLKHDYRVDLSGENIVNISLFPKTSTLKQLNLSYVQLQSLNGMKPQTALQTFIAEGSAIANFAGFAAFSGISSAILRNSVVEQVPNFAVSLLLVCPKLTTLDGKLIKQSVVKQAEKLRELEYTVELVNKGWMATYPIDDEQLEKLAEEYGIIQQNQDEETNPDLYKDDFDQQLRMIDEEHQRIIDDAKRDCGFAVSDREDEHIPGTSEITTESSYARAAPQYTLLDRIATILAYSGQKIDKDHLKESVLNVVENLCENLYEKATLKEEDFNGLSGSDNEQQNQNITNEEKPNEEEALGEAEF